MSTAEASASATPVITGSSQSSDQGAGLAAIGGNVTAVWRGWWTWSPGNGTWNLQVAWNVIGVDSTVVITASEIDGNGNRFVGDAAFQVSSSPASPRPTVWRRSRSTSVGAARCRCAPT
ncbi:hypothetical protein AB0E62_26410 [Streptomyces sp. NPDC038707]|uniref:hypothetical protein n=1 Tax=Streptomyces sp. NPDC038707 TaxID=3154329 RepID=UPI0033DD4FB7